MQFHDAANLPAEYWQELVEERDRQMSKGYVLSQIAAAGFENLVLTIQAYIGWAGEMQRQGSTDKARKRLIQVATMCLSRVQVLDADKKFSGTQLRAGD